MTIRAENQEREEKHLRSATAWQRKIPSGPTMIGVEAQFWLERNLNEFERNAMLTEVMEEIAGPELSRQCRVDNIHKGVAFIQSAPGPAMHRLKMIEQELLENFRSCCPGAGIRTVRFVVGRKT
jgi:hypothetical protein